jgi:hypothetical protein
VGPNATPLPPSSRDVECEWPSERTTADRPGWVVVTVFCVSPVVGCRNGRRVYSYARNCNDLEASAPDRTITRNATPLRLGGGYRLLHFTFCRLPQLRRTGRLGGGYPSLRFTFCRLLQRAMRRPRRMGGGHPPFTYHLSPFTFHGVPTWVATLFHESPLTSRPSLSESQRLLVSWLRRRLLRHRRSLSRYSLPKSPSIYRQANTSEG